MEDPSGAAGGISDAFHKFITGDSFIQGMKDMWAKPAQAADIRKKAMK